MNSKPYPTSRHRSKPVTHIETDSRHIMLELDPETLEKHPAHKGKGRWYGRFIAAAWVRFPEGLAQRVNLVLTYRDSERRKNFKIDTCRANRQSLILLNGCIDLNVVGEITDLALVLEGLAEDSVWMLDEYRIESAGAAIEKPKNKANSGQQTAYS